MNITTGVPEEILWHTITKQISKECAQIPSFGEALDSIRKNRRITQEELAKRLARSPAEISRLTNNVIPKYLTFADVERMAQELECSPQETVLFLNAFTCHVLYSIGLINPDIF